MEKKSFESSLKELETIVEKLEKGDLNLEESLKLYEKGIQLITYCSSQLEAAEKKIEILDKDLNGKMKAVPFDEDDSFTESEDED